MHLLTTDYYSSGNSISSLRFLLLLLRFRGRVGHE